MFNSFKILKNMDGIEQSFEEVFKEAYEQEEFNGVVVVAHQGEAIYEEAFGIADIETEENLAVNSIFNLASVSKQFTATCIMLLYEQNKLDYNDAITKYLTDLPYDNITIRHLLNHTSGLPDYEDIVEEYWEGDTENDFFTTKDLLEIYSEEELELDFEPEEKYEYSNTGYVFLACIVEKASGMSFEDFIKKYVFEPLGMKNSFACRKPNKTPKKVAQGFTTNDDGDYEDYTYNYLDGLVGDGNIFSSASDLVIYAQALINGDLLSQDTFDEAFTPATLANGKKTTYGFGWELEGEGFISHEGSWEGYNTYLGIDLEDGYVFVVLDNGDHPDIADLVEEAMEGFYE
jgi:CubicO group peptidase (beta-lactamase class C family)